MSDDLATQKKNSLIVLTTILFLFIIWYSGLYLLVLKKNARYKISYPELVLDIFYPESLSYNEMFTYDVSVQNSQAEPLGPVDVLVVFETDVPMVLMGGKSTMLSFDTLTGGERKSQQVEFILRPSREGVVKRNSNLDSQTQIIIDDAPKYSTRTLTSNVMPFEKVLTTSKVVGSILGMLTTWLSKEWWSFRTKVVKEE